MTEIMAAPENWLDKIKLPLDDWGESFRALLAQAIDGFAVGAWESLKGAFTVGGMSEDGGAADWWVAVMGGSIEVYTDGTYQHTVEYPGMLNVMVMAMLPILVIFLVFQVVTSVVRSSTAGMLRAFAGSILAVPATYAISGIVYMLLLAFDQISLWILEVGKGDTSGDDVGVGAILRLFGLWWDPTADDGKGKVMVDAGFEVWRWGTIENEPGKIILPFIVALVVLACCIVLMLMMLLRTLVILVSTTFLPVATFSLTWEVAQGIFTKWASFVVGLLLAKPIAAGIVKFGITMASIGTDWVMMIAGIALVLLAALAPVFVVAIISFMTGGGAHQFESAAGGMMRGGQQRLANSTRSVVRFTSSGARKVGGGVRQGGRILTGGK
ncbi:hypothetical protein [Brevibacterium epidermidis]|uniref:hypothetical protein n=1 Tax=Brevibacterium epidermidis TaxID=1698 RepID=UPI000BF4B6E1|nr:hypothetical protein [Brevibacterium epidermidis]